MSVHDLLSIDDAKSSQERHLYSKFDILIFHTWKTQTINPKQNWKSDWFCQFRNYKGEKTIFSMQYKIPVYL